MARSVTILNPGVGAVQGNGRAVFTVFRGSDPIISSMVCWSGDSASDAWQEIESLRLQVSDANPDLVAANAIPEMPLEALGILKQ